MLPNEPFCYTDLQYLTVPLPAEIAALRERADFAGEVRRIDELLPRVTDTVMRKRLNLERFIANGLTKDYKTDFAAMLEKLRERYPAVTAAHLSEILDMGFADVVYRPDAVYFENAALSNILDQCATYLRRIAESDYIPQPDYRITETHIAALRKYGTVRIRYTVRESVRPDIVREGKTLRVWLPYPCVTPELSDTRLLAASHPVRIDDHPLRCAYMEISDYHGETAEITLSFANTAHYREIAPDMVDEVQPHMPEYLGEQLPHIHFSPYLRLLEAEITGHHKNPLVRARRIYDYITKNVRYSFMREYRYFDDIPTYCAVNHRAFLYCPVWLAFVRSLRRRRRVSEWQRGHLELLFLPRRRVPVYLRDRVPERSVPGKDVHAPRSLRQPERRGGIRGRISRSRRRDLPQGNLRYRDHLRRGGRLICSGAASEGSFSASPCFP